VKFTELELAGAYVIEIQPHSDERGFFARTFCVDEFHKIGLETRFVQSSVSYNVRRGTVRGMHYQVAPNEEAKVVRCTSGSIFDVIVDVRPVSPTYRRWESIELTAENHRMLYIPAGMAHGFQTLEDDTEVQYEISTRYFPHSARGFRWSDPSVGISWPISSDLIISAKDRALPSFEVDAIRITG
jgi:dTDP-4-dehydrorhamnose 3,5-epimerase